MKNKKRSTVFLTALALCMGGAILVQTAPSQAAGAATVVATTLEALATEVASCENTSAEATLAEAAPCERICDCRQLTTATFTRVGATCSRAQDNAIAASSAAAVCSSGEASCGPTTYWVSSCSTNHLGQTQASSFATYFCERCHFICCKPNDCDPDRGCYRGCPV